MAPHRFLALAWGLRAMSDLDLDALERSERPAGPDDIVEAMALYGDQVIIRATTLDALIVELRASREELANLHAADAKIEEIAERVEAELREKRAAQANWDEDYRRACDLQDHYFKVAEQAARTIRELRKALEEIGGTDSAVPPGMDAVWCHLRARAALAELEALG